MRRVEERKPAALTRLRDGVSILDAGQNLSGWVRLTSLGPEGTETVLEFGEHLDAGGDLTTTHLNMKTPQGGLLEFRQTDRVIAGLARHLRTAAHSPRLPLCPRVAPWTRALHR
ncbi:alpha-L-Rhamnosidase [Arthrobacter sp. Hiyo8]|nr:alpha-L-Rhamnosidase [Arthrobacter sp. Hiyo8]